MDKVSIERRHSVRSHFFIGKENISFLELTSENPAESKNLVVLKDIIFELPQESRLRVVIIYKDGIDPKDPIRGLCITWSEDQSKGEPA